MARTVFVSRHGLIRCPGCGQHARIDRTTVREASCPFCGEGLVVEAATPGLAQRVAAAGRGGLIAASLFGATTLGGATLIACTEPQPAYGLPADVIDPKPDKIEPEPQPAYGIPADVIDDDVALEDAADGAFEPDYGLPPDPAP